MSLKVKHLNGDTTFLLTFSPFDNRPPTPLGLRHSLPGTFTILVDPWLSGPSSMWHPKFLLSKHTLPSCISNLSHIPEPNVVLISQEKPDHCHEATLRQLDPTSKLTTILAEPAAAKRIRAMKHFDPSRIHALPVFSDKKPDSVIKFRIPALTPGGMPGEVTITLIPAKLDMSGLHNAIGITYRPPSSAYVSTYYVPTEESMSRSAFTSPTSHAHEDLPITPPESPLQRTSTLSTTTDSVSSPSTPRSRTGSSPYNVTASSISSQSSIASTLAAKNEKTLSLIYSPHGVTYSLVRAYASSHLVSTASLPLTALIHAFDRVENPWWLGGNVNAGLPGGVQMARNLMAKYWIGAHDEDKDNSGLLVQKVTTRKYTTEEVRQMVQRDRGGTQVVSLEVGQEIAMRA